VRSTLAKAKVCPCQRTAEAEAALTLLQRVGRRRQCIRVSSVVAKITVEAAAHVVPDAVTMLMAGGRRPNSAEPPDVIT
jgi:hypothetical protein